MNVYNISIFRSLLVTFENTWSLRSSDLQSSSVNFSQSLNYFLVWFCSEFQVATLILENTFTSILDMAGVLLPFLKYFIGGSGSKGLRVLNCLVRSPWSTIDVIGQVIYQNFNENEPEWHI